MAATARAEYATGAVYGNIAYDLDRVAEGLEYSGDEQELRRSPEELAVARAKARARARAREHEHVKAQTFGFPVLAVVGAIAAAALFIAVLMGYVNLAATSGETTAVHNRIAELEQRREALQIQYEMTFDASQVEAYAVNILGMARPDSNSVTYYDVTLSDRAEILAEDETAGILSRVTDFLESIPEYFS